jgi:hypothetical protein
MLGREAVRLFACFGFLPLATAGGWLLVAAPWIVNTTSGYPQQAGLGIYYGIPVLTFAAVAVFPALRGRTFRGLAATRLAPAFAAAMTILTVAHFTFPEVERGRSRFLAALREIPADEPVQAMACFFPVLGYERPKSLLTPGTPLEAPWVVVRLHSSTWPFHDEQVERLVRSATESGAYRVRADVNGSMVLQRTVASGGGR